MSQGPLLWHFENNSTNDPSVELTLEEVKALARKIGFEISVCCFPALCRRLFTDRLHYRTNAPSTRRTRTTLRACWATFTMPHLGQQRRLFDMCEYIDPWCAVVSNKRPTHSCVPAHAHAAPNVAISNSDVCNPTTDIHECKNITPWTCFLFSCPCEFVCPSPSHGCIITRWYAYE